MRCTLPSGVTRTQATVFSVASFQVVFGVATLLCAQTIFNSILESQLVVREGTTAYKSWKGTPIPIYIKFYFFNMLNAEAFQDQGDKPVVEERGPYTFRQVEKKVNLVWHPDQTVSYQRKKFFYFEREMSVGPLDDTVMSLNLPMVGAVNYAKGDYLKEFVISDLLSTFESKLFVNKTIGELMFEGYEDPVLQMYSTFENEEEEEQEDFWMEEKSTPAPAKIPMDKFGWFYKRNGTSWSDGDLRMHTGQGDMERLGQIVSWNQNNQTEAFKGKCGEVTGSADGLFAPGLLKKRKSFSLWSTDACRKLSFSRLGSDEVSGVTVTKFQLDDDVFANGTVCNENSCYENNLPTGVQNVTQCKGKSPAFLSRPHFFKADEYFSNQLQIGIQQDANLHESFFMIEPQTSIPVKVQMALQLNVKIEASPGMEYVFKSLPTVYFPVLWFQSTASLPETMAGPLLVLVNLPTILVMAASCCIVLGLLGMAVIYHRVRKTRMAALAHATALSSSRCKAEISPGEKGHLQTDF